jgi:hypothetical protein
MISTVTTSTVSTVTTVALAASLALLTVVALLILLIQKEIVTASDNSGLRAYGRVLNVAVVPLLLGFLFIAVVKVSEVLR